MAWEKRGTRGNYYYRGTKVLGSVKKHYLGTGKVGEAAAAADTRERERHRAQREIETRALQLAEETSKAMERPLKAVDRLCSLLVRSELEESGFHNHHGQWRRRRSGEATE
jgi:hypothetical protein